MLYRVSDSIFDAYPNLRVGILVGLGIKNGPRSAELSSVISSNVAELVAAFDGKNLADDPRIVAWRETYASFGVKPKKHTPTAESLARRVLKTGQFPAISSAVDAYLAAELRFLLPVGGYDLSHVRGDIVLRASPGGEEFHPIGSTESETTFQGEIVYADSSSILTRMWNYRDADHSKITDDTSDLILASEAAYDSISTQALEGIIGLVGEYEQRFCGGQFRTFFLDSKRREVAF